MHKKSIFWFRQDLRLHDNTGLFHAIQQSKEILPLFILDDEIIPKFGGLEDQKFGFIRESLENLSKQIQKHGGDGVIVIRGIPKEIIPSLVSKYDIDCVYTNKSYGQRGKDRDTKISEILQQQGCEFASYKDFLLVEPQEVEIRKVFTPFYKLWQKVDFSTEELEISSFSQLKTDERSEAKDFIVLEKHPYFTLEFGKERFEHHISSHYDSHRNDLDLDGTSMLSVYHRFGIFSIRQIYNTAKNSNEHFVSEIAWREFWHHIYYHFPHTRHQEFLEKRRGIWWSDSEEDFQAWKDGKTGYPIVDAAMRQLQKTNWMHGRARMICASFLTKDLHIDWRKGEKYFAETLLDYDEAVNIGNWQWSASVGADPKPLRIFNPILQSEKFSTQAKYIKKYLPEVALEKIEHIHNPLKYPLSYQSPIVDHSEEQRITKQYYKDADTSSLRGGTTK